MMGNMAEPDPSLNRKIMYIRLMKEFGGSITDWMKVKEKDLQIYLKMAECIIRNRKMNEEMNKIWSK